MGVRPWRQEETPAFDGLLQALHLVSDCQGPRGHLFSSFCWSDCLYCPHPKCPHGMFGCKMKSQTTEVQSKRF